MAYIVDVNNAADPVDARGAGQAAEELRAIKGKLNFCTVDGAGHVTFGAGRNLTTFGINNFQGNTTLGTGTGNVHTVNGSVSVTAELTIGDTKFTTGGRILELGQNAGGDIITALDFHARAGSDFDARIIRGAGVNGSLDINNLGSGGTTFFDNSVNQWRMQGAGNFSRVIPGGSTLYPDFACRAWGNFNGTDGSLRAGGNLTFTRLAVGQFRGNFSTPIPIGYTVTGGGSALTTFSGFPPDSAVIQPYLYSTTSFEFGTIQNTDDLGGSQRDFQYTHIVVLR